MCGFVAIQGFDYDLRKSLDKISYRGLDGYSGIRKIYDVTLAHTSLPIVNISTEAIQPIGLGEEIGVFVGEIFNYTDFGNYPTDGHCVLDRYHKHGMDSFMDYDGFWSFATVDQGELVVVTDYLSQKPVYYRTDMHALASEINVLKDFGPVTRNNKFHSDTLKWGYSPTGETPWEEIRQLPPGHYWKAGHVYQYWDWNAITPSDLRTELTEATIRRLGGQREVSLLLSGGLDSSIVYGLIKEQGRGVTCIHVENNEKDYASLVSDGLIDVRLDEVSQEEALSVHQSPVDLGSVVPQIAMARKLADLGFHVVMTGDGADELFGGYRRSAEYDSQYSDVFSELVYYHLPKLDRTMMASTVELRTPFLAPAVVKYALGIPWEKRKGIKTVLKDTFGDLVPQEIIDRDKLPLKTERIRKNPMEQRIRNEEIWNELGLG